MDKEIEEKLNEVALLGLQQIRLLLLEYYAAKAKQESLIEDEAYTTFRQVANKHWNKWFKRANRLSNPRN